MLINGKRNRALAIIGNGFDMAHGYKTDYTSFVNHVSDPNLDEFKAYCDDEKSIITWELFEDNIRILTEKFFMQSCQENDVYDVNRDKTAHLREIFKEIHNLLIQYLRRETVRKPIAKLSSVKKHLNARTKAINFNYTKVAEAYTKDIFYVHGSLDENDILLGYDYREEACLAQYDDMCWSKTICREALAFRRFLKNHLGLQDDSPEFNRLLFSLEIYQSCESSGRGIDDEPEKYIPDFHFVDNFIREYRSSHKIPDIDYEKISKLVILGHGIEADQVFLNEIISECKNLKKVVIFRYHGESDSSFEKKADFFRNYCKKIECVYY